MNLLTKVSTLMTTELVTATDRMPVTVAAGLMKKHNIHHLPVVSPKGKLEGIVSYADFSKRPGRSDGLHLIGEIMTRGVAKLEPSDDIRTAANLFTLNKFHALPVVEGDKLVGILTTLDLVKMIDREEVRLEDYA